MSITDLHDHCVGPEYTYYVENVGKSYIDHCIITGAVDITHCEVLHDEIYNSLDHLPLIVHVNVNNLHRLQYRHQTRVDKHAWHQMSEDDITAGYIYIPCPDRCS
jgi:hypothetical protein